MSVADIIKSKLSDAFEPAHLEIKNESHLHAGHAGSPGTGNSHFRVIIVSSVFNGMSRVARQREVNKALADELAGPVHALAMQTLAPDEWTPEAADE